MCEDINLKVKSIILHVCLLEFLFQLKIISPTTNKSIFAAHIYAKMMSLCCDHESRDAAAISLDIVKGSGWLRPIML